MSVRHKLVVSLLLLLLMKNVHVKSDDDSSEVDSSELLDVNTEFKFASLEDLSYLSNRLTQSSDELNEEENNEEEEEEEEYKHNMKGMLDESLRWPKDLEGFVIIPYEFHKKSRYSKIF